MPDEILKQYNIPKMSTESEEEQPLEYTPITINLAELLPSWIRLAQAMSNVDDDIAELIEASDAFSTSIQALFACAVANFERNNQGFSLGQATGLKQRLLGDFFAELQKNSENIPQLTESKVKKIMQLSSSFQGPGRWLKRNGDPIELSTDDDLKQRYHMLLRQTETNQLDTILEKIVPKHTFQGITSKPLPRDDSMFFKYLMPSPPILPATKKTDFSDNNDKVNYIILGFMNNLALYIVKHPTKNWLHNKHHIVLALLAKANQLLTNVDELEKPPICRLLELYQLAYIQDNDSGELHKLMEWIRPPILIRPNFANPAYKGKTREEAISLACKNAETNLGYICSVRASESKKRLYTQSQQANERKVAELPVRVVTEYCNDTGLADEHSKGQLLLNLLTKIWKFIINGQKESSPSLETKLANEGFTSANNYRKAAG